MYVLSGNITAGKDDKKKKASEGSTMLFVVLLSGNALEIHYSFDKKDMLMITTNILPVKVSGFLKRTA